MSRFEALRDNTFKVSSSKKTNEKKTNEKKTNEKKTNEKKTNEKNTNEKKTNEKKTNEKKTNEKKTNEKKTNEKKTNEKKRNRKNNNNKKTDKDTMKPKENNKDTTNNKRSPKQYSKEKIIVHTPVIKEEEQQQQQTQESEWIKRIKQQKDEEKMVIDVNDPQYWKGAIWKGPVLLKHNKLPESCKWRKYLSEAAKGNTSCVVIPYQKTQYSRDGRNWFNSFNETFTKEQLAAMEEQRLNENIEIYSNRLQDLQEERRRESEQYYEETGKIDSFMWAEIEHKKYEEYYEKLERQWAKEEEELEEGNNDEYENLDDEDY
jgi:hypothetical protein